MSKCRSCGAEIIWIKMRGTGKAMPCDAKKISYSENMHPGASSALTLVTESGTIVRTVFDPAGDKIGYISHFSTCPNANQQSFDDEVVVEVDPNEIEGQMSMFEE